MSEPTLPDETALEAADPALVASDGSRATGLTEHDWGRKTWRSAFLIALSRTGNATTAARVVGRSRTYCHDECKEDPEFHEAWREALDAHADFLDHVAHTRATVGEQRTTTKRRERRDANGAIVEVEEITEQRHHVSDLLLRDQLRAAKPEKYGDRVTHVGRDGGPIQVEVGPRKRTAERIAELLIMAQEAGLLNGLPELPAINPPSEAV